MKQWSPLRRAAQNSKPTSKIYLQIDTNRILLDEIKKIKKRLDFLEKKIGKRKDSCDKN